MRARPGAPGCGQDRHLSERSAGLRSLAGARCCRGLRAQHDDRRPHPNVGTNGCYTSNATTAANEGCSTGTPAIAGLQQANAIAVSPDGQNVYVAAPGAGLTTFKRLSDGTLSYINTVTAA